MHGEAERGVAPPQPLRRTAEGLKGSGGAVSRILSAPTRRAAEETHLSERPNPGPVPRMRTRRGRACDPYLALLPMGFPCLRACARSGGLLPHLFTLTVTRRRPKGHRRVPAVCFLWHSPSEHLACRRPRVSLTSRVTRHRALWSSTSSAGHSLRRASAPRNRRRPYDGWRAAQGTTTLLGFELSVPLLV